MTIWGSASEHRREMRELPKRYRRECLCCGRRATHVGTANGLGMMSGCEWRVRRWIGDPTSVFGGR
jgi:hypothetical protein